jgi:uncharacterized protein
MLIRTETRRLALKKEEGTPTVLETLDGLAVRLWARACLDALGRAREEIDALNVFPVPDGDTGTNLFLTFESAVEAVEALDLAGEEPDGRTAAGQGAADAAAALSALAAGAMNGAHGNSGVILSQLLRGLADEVAAAVREGQQVGPRTVAAALADAAESAWQAVSAPVEGTMLSVARAAAEAAGQVVDEAARAGGPGTEPTFAALADAAATAAGVALERTPQQLAALREAGVVDAGGHGLCILFDVLAALLGGFDPSRVAPSHRLPLRPVQVSEIAAPRIESRHTNPFATDKFEVVYLIDMPEASLPVLRAEIEQLCAGGGGDSLVIAGGDGRYRVHVHVRRPGPVIEATIRHGNPYDLRIETLEHRAPGRVVLAAAAGPGIAELFAQAGATPLACLPGRPPTSVQLTRAILEAGVNEVVVLVNDEHGLAAASAAAEQIHRNADQANTAGIRVAVVPSKSVVQGIAALAVHEPGRRFDADVVAMSAAAGATRHGALQIATDDVWTMAGVCRAGDVLGLIDGDVALIAGSVPDAALALVDRMVSAGGEMVTLVTGQVSGVDAEALVEAVTIRVQTLRPEMDVVTYAGGQNGWPLLIGVE